MSRDTHPKNNGKAETHKTLSKEVLMRILLAEDDSMLAGFVTDALVAQQYRVDLAKDSEQAQRLAHDHEFDLMVLDLSESARQGPTVLAGIRAARPAMPVLVLSEAARVEDRVEMLDAGADGFMTKPFAFAEMAARIRALLRRGTATATVSLTVADLTLDRIERRVQRGDKVIALSSKEFALLEYLMIHAGHAVSRKQIIVDVWRLSTGITTNVVDVYINYLRRKVEAGSLPKLIHTVRGAGYELRAPRQM